MKNSTVQNVLYAENIKIRGTNGGLYSFEWFERVHGLCEPKGIL
jgi:hypothetical protein